MTARDAQRLRRLAERDRKAQDAAREARTVFLAELRQARADGSTLRQLADVTGISFQRIHQLVGGEHDNEREQT